LCSKSLFNVRATLVNPVRKSRVLPPSSLPAGRNKELMLLLLQVFLPSLTYLSAASRNAGAFERGNKRERDAKKKAREDTYSRSHHSNRPKSYKTMCAGCGKEVILQVPPLEGKKTDVPGLF